MTMPAQPADKRPKQPQPRELTLEQQFEQIKGLSLEIQSLIRQGVRDGVQPRLETRDRLLRDWFTQINSLIRITGEQEAFLQQLLQTEKTLLADIQQQQQSLGRARQGQKQASHYHRVSKH